MLGVISIEPLRCLLPPMPPTAAREDLLKSTPRPNTKAQGKYETPPRSFTPTTVSPLVARHGSPSTEALDLVQLWNVLAQSPRKASKAAETLRKTPSTEASTLHLETPSLPMPTANFLAPSGVTECKQTKDLAPKGDRAHVEPNSIKYELDAALCTADADAAANLTGSTSLELFKSLPTLISPATSLSIPRCEGPDCNVAPQENTGRSTSCKGLRTGYQQPAPSPKSNACDEQSTAPRAPTMPSRQCGQASSETTQHPGSSLLHPRAPAAAAAAKHESPLPTPRCCCAGSSQSLRRAPPHSLSGEIQRSFAHLPGSPVAEATRRIDKDVSDARAIPRLLRQVSIFERPSGLRTPKETLSKRKLGTGELTCTCPRGRQLRSGKLGSKVPEHEAGASTVKTSDRHGLQGLNRPDNCSQVVVPQSVGAVKVEQQALPRGSSERGLLLPISRRRSSAASSSRSLSGCSSLCCCPQRLMRPASQHREHPCASHSAHRPPLQIIHNVSGRIDWGATQWLSRRAFFSEVEKTWGG